MQQSSVAPTQKISDDAPYRASGPQVVQSQYPTPQPFAPPADVARAISTPPGNYAYGNSIPPQNHSIPPQNHSIPPQNVATPQHVGIPPRAPSGPVAALPTSQVPRAPSTAAAGSQPPGPNRNGRAQSPVAESMMSPPRTRWGLIIAVLVLDLGLAGAGAWLLKEGLAPPEPAKPAAQTDTSSPSRGVLGPPKRTIDPQIGAAPSTVGGGATTLEKPAPIGASSGSAASEPSTGAVPPASTSASTAPAAPTPAVPAVATPQDPAELAAAAKEPSATPSLAAVTAPPPPVATEANKPQKKRRTPAKKSLAPLDPYAPAPP